MKPKRINNWIKIFSFIFLAFHNRVSSFLSDCLYNRSLKLQETFEKSELNNLFSISHF